jgi:hypothetical protein
VDGGVGFINDAYGQQLMEALDQASDDDGHFTMDDNSGGDEVPVIDGSCGSSRKASTSLPMTAS